MTIYTYFNWLTLSDCSIDTAKDFYLTYPSNQPPEGHYVFKALPWRATQVSSDPTTRATQYILLTREQVEANLTHLFPDSGEIVYENGIPIETKSIRNEPFTTQELFEILGVRPTPDTIKTFPSPGAIAIQEQLDHFSVRQLEALARAPQHHPQLIENNGMADLILLLSDSLNTLTKQTAASAIAHLASNLANQSAIRDSNGITPLIALLNDCDDTLTKQYATRALAHLARDPLNQNAIRNGIPPLIALLNNGNDALTKEYITCAFTHLASNPINHDAIRNNHGIMSLVAVLNNSDDTLTKQHAVCALAHLAKNIENHVTIHNNNGMIPLVALLNDSDDTLTTQYVTDIVTHLVKNPKNHEIIRNSIMPLVSLLNGRENTVTKQCVTSTLTHLATNPENHDSIREHNGIAALINELNTDVHARIHDAVHALAHLSKHSKNRAIIHQHQGVTALWALLSNMRLPEPTPTQAYAMDALMNLYLGPVAPYKRHALCAALTLGMIVGASALAHACAVPVSLSMSLGLISIALYYAFHLVQQVTHWARSLIKPAPLLSHYSIFTSPKPTPELHLDCHNQAHDGPALSMSI